MATIGTPRERRAGRFLSLTAMVNYAVASHARAVFLLTVVALLAFLPGLFQLPPVDRDESSFAQATKQMIETGDYVDIRLQNTVRYKKPVGIYWLQAGVVKTAAALGVSNALTTIGLYRIPSLIGAIGAVLLTYWTALAFVSQRAAIIAGLMLASSILLGVEARLAKTDAMLLLTIVAAFGAFARIYFEALGRRPEAASRWHAWQNPAIFWTALAGGVLLKGPVILFFVGTTLVTLAIVDRAAPWLRRLKPIVGVVWLLILTLPWFVTIIGRSSGTFVTQSLQQDFFRKIMSAQESHFAPPLGYFVLFWVTFWPAATLVGMATPAVWAARREPGARLLLAWIVPAWIILELVPTKLPHYVLPLYPAIAILTAGIVAQHALSRRPILAHGARWWFVLALVLAVGVIAAHVWLGRQLGLMAWPFAAGGVVFALFAWWLFESDGAERSMLRAVAASVLLAFAIFGFTLPALPVLSVAAQTRDFLRQTGCERPLLASAGHDGPALVFLAGTDTRLTDGNNAADFLRQGPCRFALIESRHERGFLRRAEAIGLRYALGTRFDGVNLGAGDGGKRHSLAIYRSREEP